MRLLPAIGLLLLACASTPAPGAPAPEDEASWARKARAVLVGASPSFQSCYHREVRRVEDAAVAGAFREVAPPPLSGAVLVRLPVEADGRVRDPLVAEDSLANATVTECLLREARLLRFSPPPGGETIDLEVPLRFRLTGPDGG